MDRRKFLKTMVFTPTLAPFALSGLKNPGQKQLYLLSDEPETYLPFILEKINKQSLFSPPAMSFSTSHPRAEQIGLALQKKGWTKANHYPDVEITGLTLKRPSLASFALVDKGKIIDIRHHELRSLWIKMAHHPSSLLTIVSFSMNQHPGQPGEKAAVWIGGQLVEHLPLSMNTERRYSTSLGKLTLAIQNRQLIVLDSACRNKICVSSPPIRLAGERIICAPSNFLVEIQGKNSFLDTIIG
ncbi:MAG: hypothetical protein DRJ06_00205 [Candidatus Aminicenantes bacterium]|nr:MAG: hypothetical protein DRJ06_00205 [Candidatus Aminicenantes bacterium]